MPGGARDGGTFHLLLISTLTGTRQTRLQAGSLFADRAPRPDAMASRSDGFRPVGERLGRTQAAVTLRQSRSRRTTPCTATSGHEQPRAATSDHERKTGAQSPRSESPSIPCRHRRSQAGSACRGAGEKVGLKTPHRASQHDATVVSIPRSHRCSAPAESPDTRCLEAQLAQCEQTLWSVRSKRGSGSGSEENP